MFKNKILIGEKSYAILKIMEQFWINQAVKSILWILKTHFAKMFETWNYDDIRVRAHVEKDHGGNNTRK